LTSNNCYCHRNFARHGALLARRVATSYG
jgi:hypothetical protein